MTTFWTLVILKIFKQAETAEIKYQRINIYSWLLGGNYCKDGKKQLIYPSDSVSSALQAECI